jgi:hypothetical protein
MSTQGEDDGDYEVGYGRPPKASQFKSGQSGNPKGRPKGAKGLLASVKRELESRIPVTEGQRQMNIPKSAAAAKRLVSMALGGNIRAILKLVEIDQQLYGDVADDDTRERADKIEAVDLDILRHYFAAEPAATLAADTMEEEAGRDLD